MATGAEVFKGAKATGGVGPQLGSGGTQQTTASMKSDFTGRITTLTPSLISAGSPLDVKVSFDAYCNNILYRPMWYTYLTVKRSGMKDVVDAQIHNGAFGGRIDNLMKLGTMPSKAVSLIVRLEAVQSFGPTFLVMPTQRVLLDERSIVVTTGTQPVVINPTAAIPAPGTGPQPAGAVTQYQCPFCKQYFGSQSDLLTHEAQQHAQQGTEPSGSSSSAFPWPTSPTTPTTPTTPTMPTTPSTPTTPATGFQMPSWAPIAIIGALVVAAVVMGQKKDKKAAAD